MAGNETVLITRRDVEAVFGIAEAVDAVEEAFRLYGEGEVEMPPKLYLTFDKGDLRCMPAWAPAIGFASVKNVNVHPRNESLPTVMATISLVDPETGFPLAVMDGTLLTSLRTGAAGAVAARHLSREDSHTAGFIGAGRQARTQMEGLRIVRPGIERAVAFDMSAEHAAAFCEWCREIGIREAVAAGDPEEAAREADVLVTTTPSREPVVRDEWVRAGTHINAIGADAPGKQELDPQILRRARLVIDNWEQASHSGEVNVPLSEGVITRDDVLGDIGQVVTGKVKGREGDDDVTVFDSTGLAVQDLACAAAVWRRVCGDEQLRNGLPSVAFF